MHLRRPLVSGFAEGIGKAGTGRLLHGAAHTCARPGKNSSRVTVRKIVHGFRVGIWALESCVIWEMSAGAFHASHDARQGSFSHANRIHLETARPLTTVAPAEFADDSQPASLPSPSRSRVLRASLSGRKVSPGATNRWKLTQAMRHPHPSDRPCYIKRSQLCLT